MHSEFNSISRSKVRYLIPFAFYIMKCIMTCNEINRMLLMLTHDLNSVLISEHELTDTLHLHAP